jgi:AcrR family transcriptional regulator
MKKEAILQSTLKLISKRGVHNTPMSKIASEADVAVGTIYHHFDSKEEILNELYLDIKKEFGACIDSALAETQSAEEVFSEVFQAIYFYYTENPLKYSFTEQVAFTPIITEKAKNEGRQYYQSMFSFFGKKISDGTLRDIPPELMGQLCYGNIKTVIQMKLSDHQSVTDSILQEAINTSWISIVNT